LLQELAFISSVSGGSIIAAMLSVQWDSLVFDREGVAVDFPGCIERELCAFASTSRLRDLPILGTLLQNLRPVTTNHNYRDLLRSKGLGNRSAKPEFLFTATDLCTGAAWKFSGNRVTESLEGNVWEHDLPLDTLVAASASPRLSPVVLDRDCLRKTPGQNQVVSFAPANKVTLGDGSFAHDFGLSSISQRHTLLVSDAGTCCSVEMDRRQHWQTWRVNSPDFRDHQLDRRRELEVKALFQGAGFMGAHWDMGGFHDNEQKAATDALNCPHGITKALAKIATDYSGIDNNQQQNLIDWGFASCDVAIRTCLPEFRSKMPDASPHRTFYVHRLMHREGEKAW